MPSSAAERTLDFPSCSCRESVDLLLFVLEIVCVGVMEGIFPSNGVRGCFGRLELKDPKLLNDAELLKPEFNRLESILTGEGGRNDLDLSPSITTFIDLRIFV